MSVPSPGLDPLAASLFSLTAIASLLLAFVMLGSRWLGNYLYAFAAQSWTIAALSAVAAYSGNHPELYAMAALTALFRGLAFPWLLWRMIRRLRVARELHEFLRPASALVIGALGVVFAFAAAYRIAGRPGAGDIAVLALTTTLAITLIGFLILAVRREAITQIIGLLVLENGIQAGALIIIPGMPLLIELLILFDVLVLVACFGVLLRHLTALAGSSDTFELKRLIG